MNATKPMLVLAILVLSGCGWAEAIERRNAEADHNKCATYGLQVGMDDYANCRLTLEQMRQERALAAKARSAASANADRATRAIERASDAQPIISPSVTCIDWGGMITCK